MEAGATKSRVALDDYRRLLAGLPAEVATRIDDAWGAPEADADVRDGAFRFRAAQFGNLLVALPPDRGRVADRRAAYHDPTLPPRHALLAFGLWLRHAATADAIVHMGAHGTLEWLPGKAVALTAACFPEAVVGPLPVILSVPRQQSGRSGPGQAPHRRRDHRPSAAAAGACRTRRAGAGARAAGRRIRHRRRARPAAARAPGAADRRDRPAHWSRPRGRRRERQSRRGAAQDRCLAVRPEGHRHQGRAARLWAHARSRGGRSRLAGQRRGGARRSLDRARRQAREGGSRGRAAAWPARRAANRPQSLHRRSAHAADADRDGARQARGRRCDPPLSPDPRRDAARAGHRSLGQRHAQDRRRGDRPRPRADGLPADLGPGKRARHRHRGAAVRRDGTPARRCDLAHFRPVPRSVPGADRADRRGSAAGRPARRGRRREPARRRDASRQRRWRGARSHLRHGARSLWRGRRGAARPGQRPSRDSAPPISPRHRMAMAAPTGEGTALPGRFADRGRQRRSSRCTAATIRPAICSKARRMSRMSAASPRLPPRSGARPIS